MDDRGWKDFLVLLGDIGIDERVGRLNRLLPGERRSLLGSKYLVVLADCLEGTSDDRRVMSALFRTQDDVILLAGSQSVGTILQGLGPQDRQQVVRQITAIPLARAALAGNDGLTRFVRVGGADALQPLLEDPVARGKLAESDVVAHVLASAADPDDAVDEARRHPELRRALAAGLGLDTLGEAMQPHNMTALIDDLLSAPDSRGEMSRRDDTAALIATWASDPAMETEAMLASAECVAGLASHLDAHTAELSVGHVTRLRRRVLEIPDARIAVAGSAGLGLALSQMNDDAERFSFTQVLLADRAARTALLGNENLAHALLSIDDLRRRRAVIDVLMREPGQTPESRDQLTQAQSDVDPAPPDRGLD